MWIIIIQVFTLITDPVMKTQFDQHFRTQLWHSIAAIEQDSQVEVVVIIHDRSDAYQDIPLYWGCTAALLSFSYLMLAPPLFEDLVIYFAPIAAFGLAWLFARIPAVKRWSLSKARVQRSVEIMARALFQKGGIHHTQAKIGVLFYCSVFEQCVFVLPDRGALLALPSQEWTTIQTDWQAIFKAKDPAAALLVELNKLKPIFNRYIPPIADDLKELADDLEIVL